MPAASKLIVQTAAGVREIPADGPAPTRRLTELLRRAGLPLNTRCGQRGLCDGCLVELVQGELVQADSDQSISADDGQPVLRACQHDLPPGGSATLHVPARSLLAHRPQIVTSFRVDVSRAHDPLWQSVVLPRDEVPVAGDLATALCEAIARRRDHDLPLRAGQPLLDWTEPAQRTQRLAIDQRGDHWLVTSAHDDPATTHYGVAIDIGTTTVVVMLVELGNGKIVGTASALNGQTRLGDNVVTRINLCMQDKRNVKRLQHAVTKRTLRPLLDELFSQVDSECEVEAGIRLDQVKCLVIAGNTTMLHLLSGADPTSLGTVPFTPQFLGHETLRGRDLAILPKARLSTGQNERKVSAGEPQAEVADPTVHLLPGAAAYIGADVVAGVFSTGMAYRDEPCLLVDVGTNGEIVLRSGDRLWGCATAAGPAFEGSGLTSGVRAGSGAISHIRLGNRDVHGEHQVEVIGGGSAIGICGTAYVDFIAQARKWGLIGSTGRFVAGASPHFGRSQLGGRRFQVAPGTDGRAIEITESDVASLLQAKAAIAAGIVCLLQRAELSASDIATLYLAGGFGFHMDIESVIGCGLLPGFRLDQIEMVGNTSLAGAYLALMDSSALAEMKRIGTRLETIELNLEPEFESLYIDHLCLP